ncbi:acetyl-CoA carboxylase biotin carboxyl carrier protein [Candidatus Vallotia tarda]|uniref:Biotin carboxyl carrier protein of acetyl-CoA carboxylase n=1 Tax=Candidatus Vallotiella hemipterorum TaxID=1177213 RepID=A0A916JSK5_9BURK|nr:acetyl-CoA carboxylase biotin carboxyl carrier protein [Candidatus Vallotia tarda]CAG7599656.1 Biotin carboxyl carrier protein of acetyl-CoA carboxylase [Candidatus Vallotia tarda]
MDLRKLKTLIDLVSESGISELEVTEGEGKVRIVKNTAPIYLSQAQYTSAPQIIGASGIAATATSVESDTASSTITLPKGYMVNSPMVGTFYRAPSPGSDPFVQVGDSIKKGQIICIIEAMKLLNEIESDKTGTIKEILVDNGQAVEYGQPLFVID